MPRNRSLIPRNGGSLVRGECHQFLGSFPKHRAVAAKLVKDTIDVQGVSKCVEARKPSSVDERLSAWPKRLIRVTLKAAGSTKQANTRIDRRKRQSAMGWLIIDGCRLC